MPAAAHRPCTGLGPAAAPPLLWSPWGRLGGLRGRLGAPIRPHDALQEDSGSPTALRKDTNDSLLFTDLRFFMTSVAFRTLWRSGMSTFAIKTNVFLTISKTHFWSPFLFFTTQGALRAPPRPLLESDLATFGSRGPPLKLGNGPLGRPGPPRGTLLGCH